MGMNIDRKEAQRLNPEQSIELSLGKLGEVSQRDWEMISELEEKTGDYPWSWISNWRGRKWYTESNAAHRASNMKGLRTGYWI